MLRILIEQTDYNWILETNDLGKKVNFTEALFRCTHAHPVLVYNRFTSEAYLSIDYLISSSTDARLGNICL